MPLSEQTFSRIQALGFYWHGIEKHRLLRHSLARCITYVCSWALLRLVWIELYLDLVRYSSIRRLWCSYLKCLAPLLCLCCCGIALITFKNIGVLQTFYPNYFLDVQQHASFELFVTIRDFLERGTPIKLRLKVIDFRLLILKLSTHLSYCVK